MYKDSIDIFRMSASRPWQLEKTSPSLKEKLKYSGKLRFNLIESIIVDELSQFCVEYAVKQGYKIIEINPARGQGYAIDYALKYVIKSKYCIKWEDDFQAETDIPIDDCIALMEEYPHINQICFNKRKTMFYKPWRNSEGKVVNWKKEQRIYKLKNGKDIPLVIRNGWWFGSAIWRTDFIRPKFRYWDSNTHNLMNIHVLLPLAGYKEGKIELPSQKIKGRYVPTPSEMEMKLGVFIFGKHDDKRMVFHTGLGDSIWNGEMQKKWRSEGKIIKGI